jgi:glycosyltransferase involved in cell wall biosynthesis
MPHITVTIPVFNRAHLVGRTIESVLKQDFQDFNLVVVDDASTDDTVVVVRSFLQRDSRIQLFVNEKNLGLTRNWNRCLELASGPLVQILQSDDLIDPDYLGIGSEVFEKYPSVGFVAANCRPIDINDKIIHAGISTPPQLYQAGDEAVMAILTGGFPHVSSIVMKRDCYDRLGGLNEEFWFAPDIEMFTRLATHYDYYYFGGVHTSFRRHGSNSGVLEFLRSDYLPTHLKIHSIAWGYLSTEGRHKLGISDLSRFLCEGAAQTALSGAVWMLAYRKRNAARYYIWKAFELYNKCWRTLRFWKIFVLFNTFGVGEWIARRRTGVTETDLEQMKLFEKKLRPKNLLLNL